MKLKSTIEGQIKILQDVNTELSKKVTAGMQSAITQIRENALAIGTLCRLANDLEPEKSE